jgi:peptidoglycan L-alanyl-D-glutamate endopeptidase CwlK|tara:strand:+ start:223 stop:675 length:453 start_codon:yes stop_codon:yes gene_type:complete
MYSLGNSSKEKLSGVEDLMQRVVELAIGKTKQDFSVICGMRTVEEQEILVAKGASQTMKSKHLEGLAVDLMAYVNGGRWELNLYDEIADAMKEAAKELGVTIRWGAAWHKNLNDWEGSAEDLMNEYVDLRRSQGRRPFIDAPHFEIIVTE